MNKSQMAWLADLLVDVAIEADDSSDLGGCSITREKVKMAVAKEVVRQMEWVRDQCADQVGGAAENTHDRILDLKLTVAPTDWNP